MSLQTSAAKRSGERRWGWRSAGEGLALVALVALSAVASIQRPPAESQAAGTLAATFSLGIGAAQAAPAQAGSPGAAPAPSPSGDGAAAGAPGEAPAGAAADAGPEVAESPETADDGDNGTGATLAVAAPPEAADERARWLARELDAAIASRPALAGAKIGALVADLSSGTSLWQHQGELPMSLASTTKLFTAASALTALGPGYVWRTALYGGEPANATAAQQRDSELETLYLRGRGDPTLEYAALRSLARDLADRGIRKITKELVLDTGFFDVDVEPPHFSEQPKERAAFRAPVSSLSLSRNAVTIIVTADPAGGSPDVRLDPPVDGYFKLITDELLATPDGKTRIRVDTQLKRKEIELHISGQLKSDGPAFYRRIRVDDPIAFATAALRTALTEHGIRVPTKVSTGPIPDTARLLAAFDSPPLAEVLRRMNKTSDNFLAESVWKTIGAERRVNPAAPATWADAAAASRSYLATLELTTPIRIDNGSGLFDASSASAAQLVKVLRASYRDFRIAPDFLASLPVGGIDGTLQSRFRQRAALGRVRAKTGTLAAVSTLAGYVGVESSHLLAFAILVNDLAPAQRRHARALQEDLVDILALYLGVPPVETAAQPAKQ